MKKNLVLIILGGIIGVVVVRMFFLNSFQIIGWNLFWNNLSHLDFGGYKLVIKSATFGKCVLGFIIGGCIGLICGYILKKK